MVQFSEQNHLFEGSLADMALAHTLRFPSPYSSHVLSSDVILRTFTPTGTIKTTRLILKRGKVPKWAPRAILKITTSWVVEECEVDLEGVASSRRREMRVRSRNIDHKSVMEVWEWQTFRQSDEDPTLTQAKTLSRVTSDFSFWPVQSQIERFGISRVPKSSEKARAGLSNSLSLILDPSTSSTYLSSGPLRPYPFDPLPSSLTLASELVRARFEALRRQRELEKEEEVWREEGGEPGRIWRERWRKAVRRSYERFRQSVCRNTGMLCEK